jgi:hypothetical protein
MDRSADYTIQGFLYQFNKTLSEILSSPDDAEISIEGIIEDIEVRSPKGIIATQCKYHESQANFVLSLIYKPILQMLRHFHLNPQSNITYVIFAHFPSPPANTTLSISDLRTVLSTKDSKLSKICKGFKSRIDLPKFLSKFRLEFGPSYDEITKQILTLLEGVGIPKGDVDILAYPNAIQIVANLSIIHDEKMRKTTKASLLAQLGAIKATAISRWTLSLKSRRQLLQARQKQLKAHLSANVRRRTIVLDGSSIDHFQAEVVPFVMDYLDRYHYKPCHIFTPCFCLDVQDAEFEDIRFRLYKKGIQSNDGYIGSTFDLNHFLREPVIERKRGGSVARREFSLRLLQWNKNGSALNHLESDDIFKIGANGFGTISTQDAIIESVEITNFKELRFAISLSNVLD